MTTTNALAVIQQNPLLPSAEELETIKDLAKIWVGSQLLPKAINTPEKAITIALKARELGIPPMVGFSHIHVIEGKPSMSSELMLSLLYQKLPGVVVNFTETTDKRCAIKAKRPGGEFLEISFAIEDAQRAGLLSKQNWRQFPAAMLRSRCIAAMARVVGPDALMGVSYTPEELGAEVDQAGNVINIDPSKAKAESVSQQIAQPAKDNVVPIPTKVEETKVDDVQDAEIVEPFREDFDSPAALEFDPLASYQIKVGKLTGTKLGDLGAEKAAKYLEGIRSQFKRESREITGEWLELVSRLDDFVRASGPAQQVL